MRVRGNIVNMNLTRNELLQREYGNNSTIVQSSSNEVKQSYNSTIVRRGTKSAEQVQSVEKALELTRDLITEEYKGWFASHAYRLGADRYLGLAKDARKGNNPSRYFSYLLKQN